MHRLDSKTDLPSYFNLTILQIYHVVRCLEGQTFHVVEAKVANGLGWFRTKLVGGRSTQPMSNLLINKGRVTSTLTQCS